MSTGMRWRPDLSVGHLHHLQTVGNHLRRDRQRRRARAITT